MLINRNFLKIICSAVAITAVFAVIIGCTQLSDVEATINRDKEVVLSSLDKSFLPSKPENLDIVRVRDDIWLGDTSSRHKSGDLLPQQYERGDGITMVSSRAVGFFDLLNRIGNLTNIPIRASESVVKNFGSSRGEDVAVGTDGFPVAGSETMVVSYTGPLSGLLDQIAIKFNVWWRYEHGEIFFFDLETRTFTVYSLPTKHGFDSSIRSTGSGGEGASISLSTTGAIEMWDSIEKTLEAMLSENGTLTIDDASGTVTVTTSPSSMRQIAKFINEHNRRLSRQVAITVKLLQIDVNNVTRFGLDLTTAFKWPTGTGLTTSFEGPFKSQNPVGINMAIVGATGRHWERWNDSKAIIDALATQGDVSLLTTSTVTTLNNKPAPIQVSKMQSYVRNISTTVRDGEREVAISPADLNLGLTMEVLPRILDHGRILLMFSMNLVELLSLTPFTTQTSTVQLPTLETRGFSQEIAMLSGSTLVITGFEKIDSSSNKEGLGVADFQILGGKTEAKKRRTVLVVLLTPEVLESPLSPESRISSF